MPTSERPGRRLGPHLLVSDLGVFDYAGGRMRLRSYHRGITIEKIQQKTGFALQIDPDAQETPPPTVEEVRLLREVIDPLGIRELERMSGAQRRPRIRELVQQEKRDLKHREGWK